MTGSRDPVRQAVFLVGGRGTRLGEIAGAIPKPMLEVAPGLPFLDVLLDNAARQGFTKLLLLAGHLGEQIEARYSGRQVRGAEVTVLREPDAAGTGGALVHAHEALDPWFILSNGDTFFDINLRALAADQPGVMLGRLALRRETEPARYGSVKLSGDRVRSFGEKISGACSTGITSGGIYLLSREIIDHLSIPSSLEIDLFPALAHEGLLTGQLFDGYFLDMGLPSTLAQAISEVPQRRVRPAAFLDRDGVLNVDVGYAHRRDQLQWTKGARRAVRQLNEAGYYVFVVTNQAGVAHGYYGEDAVHAFHKVMQDELAEVGAHVDAFYYCPHHEAAAVPRYRSANHPDRKPNPGMILRAMQEWPVAIERSFFVGDQLSDMAAARAVGIQGVLFDGCDLLETVRCEFRAMSPASTFAKLRRSI